ncbi:mucin-5AC-like [Frankliniella occidentalis]|uniref:Mucin-5AC-like n=1 Tax=Frankliniella occidentalis TaxID=133901 RepID=A0A9C6XRS1_FRAOC|nr:mucin-5AC-like [Frankliniella occidentalis]
MSQKLCQSTLCYVDQLCLEQILIIAYIPSTLFIKMLGWISQDTEPTVPLWRRPNGAGPGDKISLASSWRAKKMENPTTAPEANKSNVNVNCVQWHLQLLPRLRAEMEQMGLLSPLLWVPVDTVADVCYEKMFDMLCFAPTDWDALIGSLATLTRNVFMSKLTYGEAIKSLQISRDLLSGSTEPLVQKYWTPLKHLVDVTWVLLSCLHFARSVATVLPGVRGGVASTINMTPEEQSALAASKSVTLQLCHYAQWPSLLNERGPLFLGALEAAGLALKLHPLEGVWVSLYARCLSYRHPDKAVLMHGAVRLSRTPFTVVELANVLAVSSNSKAVDLAAKLITCAVEEWPTNIYVNSSYVTLLLNSNCRSLLSLETAQECLRRARVLAPNSPLLSGHYWSLHDIQRTGGFLSPILEEGDEDVFAQGFVGWDAEKEARLRSISAKLPAPRPGGASRPRPTGPGSSEQQEAQQQPGGRRYQQAPRKNSFRNAASTGSNSIQQEPAHTRRVKPRLHTSAVDQGSSPSTSLYKFKLSRPNGRWQYKTTPKPRINIRRQDGDGVTPAPQSLPQQEIGTSFSTSVSSSSSSPNAVNPEQGDIEPAASSDPDAPEQDAAAEDAVDPQPAQPQQETIKVSISTPADFRDTYYEVATIRSPYTFQVGQNKNTRFITVTSTFERTLEPTTTVEAIQPTLSPSEPLTENILASTTATAYDKRLALEAATLDTLPPIHLASDQATPPLLTETETFSTTQVLLKTHILPVVRGPQNTTLYTLVQTYSVTRLVTAIKTLPPMEVYQFVPSRTLTDLNTRLDEAGSELHLELDFGDDGNGEDNDDDENPAAVMARIAPDLDLASQTSARSSTRPTWIGTGPRRLTTAAWRAWRPGPGSFSGNGSPSNGVHGQGPTEAPGTTPPPTTPNPALSNEQLQQLALLRFLNPQAAAALNPQVITTSKPVFRVETLYESHVIPVFNGLVTSLSTLSRPVSTVTRTEYELATSTALPPPQALQPQGFPAFPPLPQANQYHVTSSPLVTQTMVTQTESKVLKLTFGAKTAYTTLFSTRVVPTLLTTYLTANVPVQPTAAPFPGYYPSPCPSYPYVG